MVNLIAVEHNYYDELYRVTKSFYPEETIVNKDRHHPDTKDATIIFSIFENGILTTELINPFGEVVSTSSIPVPQGHINQSLVGEGLVQCFTNFDMTK